MLAYQYLGYKDLKSFIIDEKRYTYKEKLELLRMANDEIGNNHPLFVCPKCSKQFDKAWWIDKDIFNMVYGCPNCEYKQNKIG